VWLAWEKYGWLGKSVAGLGKTRLKFRLAKIFSADIFMADFSVEPNF